MVPSIKDEVSVFRKLYHLFKAKTWSLQEKYFRNFVYIHINKTGGSSIEKALHINFEHKTAREKKTELGDYLWNTHFTFTIIRNPWDKVVSHYYYRVMTNQTNLATDKVGFDEWVRLAYGEHNKRYYDNPKMFLPQWDWVTDEGGNMILNFIGRYENLTDDFEYICRRINLHEQLSLPHVKRSNRGNYRDYYNDDTKEIVRRYFMNDVENFNYLF